MFKQDIKKHIADTLDLDETEIEISTPPKPDMGDIALPCFRLAKLYRQNPNHIALEIANAFIGGPVIEARACGPYVNLTIDAPYLAKKLLTHKSSFESKRQTIVVDYSSPNIAKHLGIHHLRSTMIGNAICNLHEYIGNQVIRLNYLGDWGTQFGVLLAACDYYNVNLDAKVTLNKLVELYVEYSKEAENNPELKKTARQKFKALENETFEWLGGKYTALWRKFRQISLEEFKNIYKRLGVGPDGMVFQGESNFYDTAEKVVVEALEKGVAIESQGATIIPMGNGKAPCILRKTDGATTYQSRDIAAAIAHHNKYNFDQKLYVVGHGQTQHFEQVFNALRALGYQWADRCHHIPFGLLRFEAKTLSGVKRTTGFSSRRGNIVLLRDALDTAKNEVAQRVTLDDSDLDIIGVGAVVFADLSVRRIKDSTFKWEEILKFEGSTGPYLQYTTVRCASILTKSKVSLQNPEKFINELTEIEEKQVILSLFDYEDYILRAATEAEPSILSHYLLNLARNINHYLHKQRIIQDNKKLQTARTYLVSKVHSLLREGLKLLGVPVPTQM